MKNNTLFVFAGNCRTFIDCFDSCYKHVISKLCSLEESNIYIYLYLKVSDPGPKGMGGWDFSYTDVNESCIHEKISQIHLQHPQITIDFKLIHKDEISDTDLLHQVKTRNLFVEFYSNDATLIRGMHCHYNFEKCGEYIIQKEKDLQLEFSHIIYIRPDLFFTESCMQLATYTSDKVILGFGIHRNHNDHFAIMPRKYMTNFFFDRMKVYRENTATRFRMPEDVYCHTIPYVVEPIGKYVIKRS